MPKLDNQRGSVVEVKLDPRPIGHDDDVTDLTWSEFMGKHSWVMFWLTLIAFLAVLS